jgi:Ricin-type beta-trefoil lectin domain-like
MGSLLQLELATIMAPANQTWWWYTGVTGDQVGQLLTQNKAMLISMDAYVDADNTVKLAVVMEPATKQWWWWVGLTAAEVGQYLTQNKAQLTDISAYIDTDNQLKFAVIMGPGTGTGWWYGYTGSQVGQLLTENKARLATISAYVDVDNTVKFAFAAVPANQEWWWYFGQTGEQVGQLLTQNKAMLTDICAYVDTDYTLKFVVVMAPANQTWWWYYGDPAYIQQQLTQNKARLTMVSPYAAGYFIKSKLGNVIDIVGASTNAGAGLDAWPQKSSGIGNQLWEFVADPAGSGYYFIKSKLNGNVIDIEGASTKAGTLLDAWPQKSSGTDNQLWEFVTDPAGSGYCFIKSKLSGNVIDVQGASTAAGALLDAYPWKLTGYDNQLWTVVGGSFPSVVGTVPGRQGGDSGYFNYILANGSSCATLTGVKATIYFTEDLVWESSSQPQNPGFSIQLNAETNNNQPLDWLQFVVHIGNDPKLFPWINIWQPAAAGQAGNPAILWNQQVKNPVATMPQAARIPAGYSIIIALQNDSAGRVISATWTVLDGSGNTVGTVNYPLSTAEGGGVPPTDLCPIASLQVTFGGALDGAYATFSSGAGVIIYQADQAMTVDSSWPGCIGYTGGTGESSNIGYSLLEATPGTLFSQAFGVVQGSAQVRQINPQGRKLPVP